MRSWLTRISSGYWRSSQVVDRYARQLVLKEIGPKGQAILKKKVVAIIGLGGIGGIAAQALARAGVGKLILVDPQDVDITNLQRQVLYKETDLEKSKVKAAEEALIEANSELNIEKHKMELSKDNIDFLKSDLILDCSDNLQTRFMINDFAVKNKVPWIFATALRTSGLVHAFLPGEACFRCLFPDSQSPNSCMTVGILNTAAWLTGCLQATDAIQFLLGKKSCSHLVRFDIWKFEMEKIKVKKNPKCKLCGA